MVGEGFRLYIDGIRGIHTEAKGNINYVPTNGRVAVGRRYTENNGNDDYTIFEADELFFFNRTLTDTEIRILSQTAWNVHVHMEKCICEVKIWIFCLNRLVAFSPLAKPHLFHRSQSRLMKCNLGLFKQIITHFIDCSKKRTIAQTYYLDYLLDFFSCNWFVGYLIQVVKGNIINDQ